MYSHGVCMNKGDLAYSAVGDCKRNPIRNILKWVPVVREVGYARSSADGKDNITFPERRGISSEMISTGRSTFTLSGALEKKRKSQMSDDERVRSFQRKLYQKSKQEETFRFYVLYDKLCLPYVLREAYKRCRKNGGSPGVDGVTFASIEDAGVDGFLERIRNELEQETYRPEMVRRVYIPKANGKMRPLGIPTIKGPGGSKRHASW
jgi:hypothetical protein